MTIYRVTHRDADYEHRGYTYLSVKADAIAMQDKENKENGNDCEVQFYNVRLTKKGVLEMLNAWASHPDNG
jgi:hypothetical protein